MGEKLNKVTLPYFKARERKKKKKESLLFFFFKCRIMYSLKEIF